MQVVVPLAGPDYFKNKIPKGLEPSINNNPQLYHTLKSRIWSTDKNINYSFILHDSEKSRSFVRNHIDQWFPNSNYIYLSNFTKGAALSAISAISFIELENSSPLIFDLADIFFETNIYPDFEKKFSDSIFIGYSFKSDLPIYSYFGCDPNFYIKSVSEKKVISDNASAGVYIYKSASYYLNALAEILTKPRDYLFNNLLYLAPVLNGILDGKRNARLIHVEKYYDYKS